MPVQLFETPEYDTNAVVLKLFSKSTNLKIQSTLKM